MSAPQPFKRRHQHYAPTMATATPPQPDFWELNLADQCTVWAQNHFAPAPPTYSGALDGERLTSQLEAVLALMADHAWRTLAEIRAAIGRGSEAGISARLREIRNSRRGVVERRRRGDPKAGLWEYAIRLTK